MFAISNISFSVGLNPGIDLLAHHLSYLRLGYLGEEVEPEVRGADVIGFLHDEVPPFIKP